VRRERDPADERSVIVTVTAEGNGLRARAASIPSAVRDRLGMPIEEMEQLIAVIAAAGDLWAFSAGAGRAATRRSGTPPRRFRKCRLLRGLYRHTKAGSPRQSHLSSLQTGRRQPQISMRQNGRTGVAP
jgi:DNA-binding MarR family transcriptional regulator